VTNTPRAGDDGRDPRVDLRHMRQELAQAVDVLVILMSKLLRLIKAIDDFLAK
jgi:hypothetical protein